MRRFLWWTLLLSLTALLPLPAVVQAQRVGVPNHEYPYLLNNQQRRNSPNNRDRQTKRLPKQPGSGTSGQVTGVASGYSKREETELTSKRELSSNGRTTFSDWELIQQWMQPDVVFPENWKTHRGTADECVALVQVRGEGGTLNLYSALVVRCDGFLMVPQPVWDAVRDKRDVQVLITKAEGEDEVGPFPIRFRNPHKSRQKDFHFIKLNDHHVRCLPLLAAWNLTKGNPVQVVWAALAADGKTIEARSAPAVCTSVPTDFRGTLATLAYSGGRVPEGLTSGAVVVDRESGAALGMITNSSKPTEFSNTRLMGDIFSDIALAPDRDAALGKDPQDPNMAKIPGEPAFYDEKEFVNAYQTAIVCTPDFYCDKFLVTIGEWLQYLDTRRDRPLPEGWDTRNRKNSPSNYPKLPVTGPTAGDMKDYATLHHKRLITTVEWILAARTTHLDWLERLEAEMGGVSSGIIEENSRLKRNVEQRVDDISNGVIRAQVGDTEVALSNPNGKPANTIMDLTTAYSQSLATVRSLSPKFALNIPGQPHDVATYAEDKSDYGIMDVVMNVPEACLGWGNNYAVAPKLFPAGQDPFVSELYYVAAGGDGKGITDGIWGTVAGASLSNPIIWSAVWGTQFGGIYRDQPASSVGVAKALSAGTTGVNPAVGTIAESRQRSFQQTMTGGYVIEVRAKCNLGFRCAR